MPLTFANTRDHALLAMVIQEARVVADERQGFLGRTAVHKMMYFLRVAGVPMSYRFSLYHYGPFCQDILSDIDYLLADEVVEDRAMREHYSNYAPGKNIDELLRNFQGELEPHRERVQEVIRLFAPLNPAQLELVATLDYIHRHYRAQGQTGDLKDKVVEMLMRVKVGKFTKGDAAGFYDAMKRVGLLQ
jgi:uncharacterized protein YwgA